jgi:cytochrome c556
MHQMRTIAYLLFGEFAVRLQLRELLHEMGRADSAHAKVADFQRMPSEAESGTKALEDALSSNPMDLNRAQALFNIVDNTCTSCHQAYRD